MAKDKKKELEPEIDDVTEVTDDSEASDIVDDAEDGSEAKAENSAADDRKAKKIRKSIFKRNPEPIAEEDSDGEGDDDEDEDVGEDDGADKDATADTDADGDDDESNTDDADEGDDGSDDDESDTDDADEGDNGSDTDDADERDDDDGDDEGGKRVRKEKVRVPLINTAYDGLLPVSVLAALIGAILGFIPAAIFTYLTGTIFYPLFLAAPLLAYLFNSLLKGGRDIRALISVAVLSLASAYITALSCQAAIYAAANNLSLFRIPLITILSIGDSDVIPASASAYLYPLIFTLFGVAVVWELFRGMKRVDLEPEDVDDVDDADDADDVEDVEDAETEEKEKDAD